MLAALLAANLILRDIVVVNRSDEAVFTLKIGHVSDGTWGDDLLGFANVIDVSRGVTLHIPVDPGNCVSDIQATLRSGTVVVVPSMNLCTTTQIDVKPDSN